MSLLEVGVVSWVLRGRDWERHEQGPEGRKARPGSGEWASLTAGAQDLCWEPGGKVGAGVGQNGEGLAKRSRAFELALPLTEQTRGAGGFWDGRGPACFSPA